MGGHPDCRAACGLIRLSRLFLTFNSLTTQNRSSAPWRSADPTLPANYHLTFSRSETNEADCKRVLEAGGNVAVVFAGEMKPMAGIIWLAILASDRWRFA